MFEGGVYKLKSNYLNVSYLKEDEEILDRTELSIDESAAVENLKEKFGRRLQADSEQVQRK